LDIDASLKPDIVGDIHDIKTEKRFDAVIATQVLEHCKDPRKAISEMHKVLKENGTMVLSVPFLFYYHGSPKDYYRFTEDSLKELTKDFKEVQIISIGNKFLTIWQLLSVGKWTKRLQIQKLFHLLNPLIKYFDFVKKTDFALGYIVAAKK
jgi:SAM-dependent methyltransferase